ncbi:alginate lyase [Aquaticitalea lipolytica]|jgi:hypothetical protein|uniref:Alginate lyase n=1 Tax=Aquaticitalea lipolytica TaxID=1247562 RepID=A0A8J2TPK0_9FLAO|nr:polysaccharide lyase family 7 protein [Aquaticitalea lipolytica]GFZ87061.1 alginate lyase [Aquaticitalea lipolytica]
MNAFKALILLIAFSISINASCQNKKRNKYKLPEIDLSHWSVTTPAVGKNGKPISVEPPAIMEYGTNEDLKPYMYNDSIKGALVFYAYPSEATTANTKYSRSELREQMVPGDNNTNWTFAQGANMKGKLQMDEVSRGADGKYHKVIIMQIHGRLTNEQRDLIGQKDNNAPPILKIYWQNGKIRVKTKILKDLNATGNDLLHEEMWDDDEGFNFEQEVGFKKFTLEVQVSEGKMVVILNNSEYKVYENVHMRKWGIFENYFKAGNYFQSRDEGAFARVNYYSLEVTH